MLVLPKHHPLAGIALGAQHILIFWHSLGRLFLLEVYSCEVLQYHVVQYFIGRTLLEPGSDQVLWSARKDLQQRDRLYEVRLSVSRCHKVQ